MFIRSAFHDCVTSREQLEREAGTVHFTRTKKILTILIRNLKRNPTDQHYRTIKKTNKVIQEKLLVFPAAVEVLHRAGFEDDGSGRGHLTVRVIDHDRLSRILWALETAQGGALD